MKKGLLALFAVLGIVSSAYSVDLSFRINPAAVIPMGKNFDLGFSGFAQADVDLFGFMTVGAEGGASMLTSSGLDDNVTTVAGGIGIGAYYFPLSRLYLGAGGSFGLYEFTCKTNGVPRKSTDLYYRGYGEVGFRFSPTMTLSANGGYVSYLVHNSIPLCSGPFAGVSLKISASVGNKNSSSFDISIEQSEPVYPVYYQSYKESPIGILKFKNNESAEIRNVHISFRAGKYSASTYETGFYAKINRNETKDIPLKADFSNALLKFTENGKVAGEVVIDYEFLGAKKQAIENVVIDVYNRNAFVWSDDTAIASFISPVVTEVQDFSSYIYGIAENCFLSAMNNKIQTAAAMVEGLRAAGIKYSEDKETPFVDYHLNGELDSVQFPLQTMNYLSGDYDDLGILLASCLESVGVSTGFMTLEDDFIVLVDTNISSGTEGNHFADPEGLLDDEVSVYLPLSMASFDKGFTECRRVGAEKIKMAKNGEIDSNGYAVTSEAWSIYPSAILTGTGTSIEKPAQSVIEKAMKDAVNDYIKKDLEVVIENARKSGSNVRLGLAFTRAGRYAEAKTEFKKTNTESAMTNLANIYMIEGNYIEALNLYNTILEKNPSNVAASKGLEKANSKLGL